jgi:hypothetical protein
MMYLDTSSKLKSVRKAEESVLFCGETLTRDSDRSGGKKAMRLDARELPASEGTGDAAPDDIGPPQDVMRPSGTWYAISVPRVSSNRA